MRRAARTLEVKFQRIVEKWEILVEGGYGGV